MSYVKKTLKIKIAIVITCIMIIIIGTLIGITINRRQTTKYYLTNMETYYLSEDNKNFDVIICSSVKNDMYLKLETIDSINLVDEITNDYFKLQINQVEEETETINYNGRNYYKYRFSFKLPITIVEDEFQLNNVKLLFDYKSQEQITLPIGAIIVYVKQENNNINISCLKGVINKIDNNSILTGIGITLTSKKNITINNIETMDNRITIQGNKITELNDENYDNATPMEELLDQTYDTNVSKNSFNKLYLESNVERHYLLPVAYNSIQYISTIGLKIYYQIENANYCKVVYPFKFFNSSNKEIRITKYE